MQDRQHRDLDPAFIDDAWSQMREQLDEVMPVRTDRRRGIIFWWLAAATVALLGTAWWWMESGVVAGETQTTVATAADDISENPDITIAVDEVMEQAGGIDEHSTQEEHQATAASGPAPAALAEPVATERPEIQQAGSTNLKELPQAVDAVPQREQIVVANEPEKKAYEPILPSASPAQGVGEVVREASSLAPLPRLQWEAASESANIYTSVLPEPTKDSKPGRKWHVFSDVSYGLGLDESAQFARLGSGVALNVRPNWQVDLAVQFEQLEQGGNFPWPTLKNTDRAANEFSDVNSPTAGYGQGVSVDSLLENLSSQRFHLPLQLRYSPGRSRWSFSAGAVATYYHRALVSGSVQVQDETLALDQTSRFDGLNLYEEGFVNSLNAVISNAGSSQTLDPRRWVFSWTIGAGFRLAPRWEIQTHLRTALTDWPNQGQQVGPRMMVDLGVRYYWR